MATLKRRSRSELRPSSQLPVGIDEPVLTGGGVVATPATRERVEEFLGELGAEEGFINAVKRRVEDFDVQQVVTRFRRFAQENPAVILAALSAVVLGGAVVAERAVRSSRRRSSPAPSKTSSSRSAKKASRPKARATSKRTLIEPHEGDKRYVRRDAEGHFTTQVSVGRSLAADRRSKATTAAKKGQGDRGDVRR
jgi:hypothetical protein